MVSPFDRHKEINDLFRRQEEERMKYDKLIGRDVASAVIMGREALHDKLYGFLDISKAAACYQSREDEIARAIKLNDACRESAVAGESAFSSFSSRFAASQIALAADDQVSLMSKRLLKFASYETAANEGVYARVRDFITQPKSLTDVAERYASTHISPVRANGFCPAIDPGFFRLPATSEIPQFLKQHHLDMGLSVRGDWSIRPESLQSVMEGMKSPWLHQDDIERSVKGFVGLQGIGLALNSVSSYSDNISSVLRVGLGDWRQNVRYDPIAILDPATRTEMYIARGFNPSLTEFPPAAFREGMAVAGLLPSPKKQEIRRSDEDDGVGLASEGYRLIHKLESRLREFIDRKLSEAYGDNWVRTQASQYISEWKRKRGIAVAAGHAPCPLIYYADFTEYLPLIEQKNHWVRVFKDIFVHKTSVQESFRRLYPIRICVMHARPLTQDDLLFLFSEFKRLMMAMDNDGQAHGFDEDE